MYWTIRQRILTGFGVVLALMLTILGFSVANFAAIQRATDRVKTDALPGVHDSALLTSAWQEHQALLAQRLQHQDPAKLEQRAGRNRVTIEAEDGATSEIVRT
jgi:hypothetical protein